MKIVVIGGGASGLMAAIIAKTSNNEVVILEANQDIGKKILATGNGRCNYWHSDIDLNSYYTDSFDKLSIILNHKDEVLNYLNYLGLVPKIKEGYYYPLSLQASSVHDLFKYQLIKKGIKVINNYEVKDIVKEENKFVIKGSSEDIICDKVIVSMGSKAFPKLGGNEQGYNILKTLGHTLKTPLPSLSPLIVKDAKKYNWAGIRSEVSLCLVSDFKTLKEERGEIQLTEKGISGICTFNLSGSVSREIEEHKDVKIYINFLPEIDDLNSFIDERLKNLGDVTINELFNSLLNYKLIGLFCNLLRISSESLYSELSLKQKKWLINNITNFECDIIESEGFERAQVCTGGVLLEEINPENMESLIMPNLYITGEILNVDGICGGYNLAFAFISGYLAGKDSRA